MTALLDAAGMWSLAYGWVVDWVCALVVAGGFAALVVAGRPDR